MTDDAERIPQDAIDAAARRFALRAASELLRMMAEEDVTVEELARRLGVGTPPVIRVLLGRNWRGFRILAALTLAIGVEMTITAHRINAPEVVKTEG